MDLMGPLPTSADGKRFIAVITDHLTRYTYAEPLVDKSAMSVASAFYRFVCSFGIPKEVITDQGTEFLNNVLDEIMRFYNIDKSFVKSYRPSANGLVESKNRVIMTILKVIVSENPLVWSEALPTAMLAINSAYNRSIKETPYFLMFARDPHLPYSSLTTIQKPIYCASNYKDFLCNITRKVFESVKYQLERISQRYQHAYDIKYKTKEFHINVDDLVYCKRLQPRAHKLEPKYLGPFRVTKVLKDGVEIKSMYNYKTYVVHNSYILTLSQVDDEDIQCYATPPPPQNQMDLMAHTQ